MTSTHFGQLSGGILATAALGGIVGCGTSRSSSPAPGTDYSPAVPVVGSPAHGFHLALAVKGVPDPTNPQFVADQQGLFDATQFKDSNDYPVAHHWKVDTQLQPGDVTSVQVIPSTGGDWAIALTFTPAGDARVSADTRTAYGATPNTAENQVALFVGSRVESAPFVSLPSSDALQIASAFTRSEAEAIARAIAGQ